MAFGARPSLRSGRIDQVRPDGVEIAESVAQAAGTFAKLYGEKKQKDSRLHYALAKNEIMALDLAQREGLKDRTDFDAFDEDYSTGFNTGRDEIMGRYGAKLSGTDSALLGSESDLIREKGRVAAGNLARGMEIDQGRADIELSLDVAAEAIQLEGPENQNALMLQALETVNAATEGETAWFTKQEGETLIQAFVVKTAVNSLEKMDKADMIAEIELSLAHREARGAITRDDIANEKGSGSIADFLHASVLEDMLEKGKEEHKNATQYEAVYGIIDAVTADFPGTTSDDLNARDKAAYAMLDPKDPEYGELKKLLQTELGMRNNRDSNRAAQADAEQARDVTNWIDEQVAAGETPTLGDLRTMPIWTELSPDSKVRLEAYAKGRSEGHEFALSDDSDFEHEWRMYSAKQKIEQLQFMDSATYKSRITRATRDSWMAEANALKKSAEAPGTLKIWRGDSQDEVLQNMLVGENKLFPRAYPPSSTSVQAKRYQRIDAAVNKAITEESVRRAAEGGTGEIFAVDIETITSEILRREVFIREGLWGEIGDRRTIEAEIVRFDALRDASGKVVAARNIEFEPEALEAYIPIDQWRDDISTVPRPGSEGNKTWEEALRSYSSDPDGVSDKTLEEAYFYLNALPEETGWEYARRRIRGEDGV
jgi:hypothetical protein